MTRKEQLDWLCRLRSDISYMDFSIDTKVSLERKRQYRQVLSEVIKVLEKEPITKNDLAVDCISRDAVLKPYEGLKDEDTISVWLIRKNIEQQPFVKQEPKIGHWIDTDEWRETVDGFEQWGYFRKCSKCGYVFKFLEIDNYCPNCGADMREVKE